MTRRQQTTSLRTPRTVPSVIFVLRRMAGAITCSATTASTTSAGCVWGTGEHMGQSTTSAPGMFPISLLRSLRSFPFSRYKENPNIANESAHAQAREALKKYLHYFERWENHSRSMKLEAVTLETIKNRITVSIR